MLKNLTGLRNLTEILECCGGLGWDTAHRFTEHNLENSKHSAFMDQQRWCDANVRCVFVRAL